MSSPYTKCLSLSVVLAACGATPAAAPAPTTSAPHGEEEVELESAPPPPEPQPPPDATRRVGELTEEEREAMSASIAGRVGPQRSVECPDGSTATIGDRGEGGLRAPPPECAITVGELEACMVHLATHPCGRGGGLGALEAPECAPLRQCMLDVQARSITARLTPADESTPPRNRGDTGRASGTPGSTYSFTGRFLPGLTGRVLLGGQLVDEMGPTHGFGFFRDVSCLLRPGANRIEVEITAVEARRAAERAMVVLELGALTPEREIERLLDVEWDPVEGDLPRRRVYTVQLPRRFQPPACPE